MIDFTVPDKIKQFDQQLEMIAQGLMRPYSREMDESEHDKPWDFINATWQYTSKQQAREEPAAAEMNRSTCGDGGGAAPSKVS
jgi:acyl-CoA dehydrogenase